VKLLATVLAALALAGTAAAAVRDHVSDTSRNFPAFINTAGLCAGLQPASEPSQTGLSARTHGFVGTIDDSSGAPLQQVHLAAELRGTIVDTSGRTYRVRGHFRDDSVHNLFNNDLRFDGAGVVVAFRPGSVLVAKATFRVVTGPSEFQLVLTHVAACHIS
jgi:hypothetical protein